MAHSVLTQNVYFDKLRQSSSLQMPVLTHHVEFLTSATELFYNSARQLTRSKNHYKRVKKKFVAGQFNYSPSVSDDQGILAQPNPKEAVCQEPL